MGLIKEFKEFIIKGNAIDMAVGIVIGAAFGAVVTSLVQDVMMPPLGALLSGADFSKLNLPLTEGDEKTPAVVISYGKLINAVIALLIQGFAIFMVVKAINALKKKNEAPPAAPVTPADIQLLTEIRDLLKKS